MLSLGKASAIRRAMTAAQRIPYVPAWRRRFQQICLRRNCIQVFRLAGASLRPTTVGELKNWHERLNVLWRNIAGPTVALWVFRFVAPRREGDAAAGDIGTNSPAPFADRLPEIPSPLANETVVSELYLAVVYRPSEIWRRGR